MEKKGPSDEEKVEACRMLEDMVKRLDNEVNRIQEAVKKEAVARKEMQRAAESLKASQSRAKVLESLENMQLNIETMEKWIHSSNESFPDKNLVSCCEKLDEQFNVWVPGPHPSAGNKRASPGDGQCQGETSSDGKCPPVATQENIKSAISSNSCGHSGEASQTQCDSEDTAIQATCTKMTSLSLKSGDLQESRLQLRQMLKKGQVYAVQENEKTGKKLYARISVDEKDRILLHTLRHEEIHHEDNLTILKHKEILHLVGTTNRRAFLDFGVKGTFMGRVIVSVIDEGNYAENFLWLCSGQKEGYSHCQSKVIDSCWQIYSGELHYMALGDFEWQDSFEDGAVLPGVDWKEESEKAIYAKADSKAGFLWGDNCSLDPVSQFTINTVDIFFHYSCRFGKVEEGLQIIKDMFPKDDDHSGEEVITDCGIIIS